MSRLDDTDERLIAVLRRDGRASISALAIELGIGRATVKARLDRLRRDGPIVGFTVVVDGDAGQRAVRGIMMIEIEGKGTSQILDGLFGLPEVQSVHTTNGRWDVVCEIGTDTLEALDNVLRRIRLIRGVANSETSLYLTTKRATRPTDVLPNPNPTSPLP